MSGYGTQPTGFARKPLQVILQEIEVANIGVFGDGLIQTSESPQGQLNGLFSYSVNELWELAEDVYQSFDPDQAEGTRLESIAKLRILRRNGVSDIDLRTQINNEGITKFNLKDVEQALLPVDGITYLKSFLNDDGELTSAGAALGDTIIAVIGGDNTEIADSLLLVLPIGGNTFGNTVVTTSAMSSVSQDFNILRVTELNVALDLQLRLNNDRFDLFQPDIQSVIQGFVESWLDERINGRDVDSFTIRRLIECRYPNIELVSFTATVNGGTAQALNDPVAVPFSQIAKIVADDVSAVFV